MSQDTITLIWIVGGIALMLLELLVPGLVIVFFGAGAVVVGVLNWTGLVDSIVHSLTLWFVLSIVFVIIFRKIFMKMFPADTSYQLIEDDVLAAGKIVEVLKNIDDQGVDGRISFEGTSWPASCDKGTIKAGNKARILYRDNISWIVEAADNTNSKEK